MDSPRAATALARVREDLALVNVKAMIPFCRTVDEGKKSHRNHARRWLGAA